MTEMLEDLDFADDIALLSNRHCDMQEKANRLANTVEKIGLKINSNEDKRKIGRTHHIMRYNY